MKFGWMFSKQMFWVQPIFVKAVIPEMQKNNYGRIVNIASIRGFYTTSGNVHILLQRQLL